MYTFVVVMHILACMALILIVLLQTGRGAEMGAAFGGASQTLFGSSGGTSFLGKLTTGAAIVFMITCLGLTYLSGGPPTRSIMRDVPAERPGPVLPEAQPVQPMPAQPDVSQTAPAQESREAATPAPQPQAPAASPESAAPAPTASPEGTGNTSENAPRQ